MKQYPANNIRNIVLAGHSGSGKTSLAEAMLHLAGASDRFGKVAEGNTVCDFDPEEIRRKTSVSTAVAPLEFKGCKINLIDVPGLFDFEGGVREGIRAAECAVITVSSKSGVAVGTEKAFKAADQRGISKIFFVSKMDSDHANFYKALEGLEATFGTAVCPLVVPYVEGEKVKCYVDLIAKKAYTYKDGKATETAMPDMGGKDEELLNTVYEAVAETDEELMEKYFSGEPFTDEELKKGISNGVREGTIYPVYCGAALTLDAVDLLMDGINHLVPSPAEAKPEKATGADGSEVEIKVDENGDAALIVFKTIADPFVGKLSYFKVVSGKITGDSVLYNMRTESNEKMGKVVTVRGKKQEDAPYIGAGDIGAVAKLQSTKTGDTLCAPSKKVTLAAVDFPEPSLSMAIAPKKKGEEEKITQGLLRLMEEDPCLSFTNNPETRQMIVNGLGDQHLDVIVSKLKSKFGTEVVLSKPRVAYRETIRKTVQVQGRHKKQSGGHGQFGDIWVRFEPCESEGLEFAEEVVGGSVPKNFFPAVEKGFNECMSKGVLAGYPMVGLRVVLYDGSYHPVDSSEMAFKMAAHIAFKDGIPKAGPVLLEPIGSLLAYVPNDQMGDLMGEVNKRRGRVLGMNPAADGMQELAAEVPMAEMADFTTFMRQCTQGRGFFKFTFERYEEAPAQVAQKVIEEAKANAEE
ncbi:MAG: elongation factor G [Clostridia bacterium]|nr:elongation factor G [Clostridia bacterium]